MITPVAHYNWPFYYMSIISQQQPKMDVFVFVWFYSLLCILLTWEGNRNQLGLNILAHSPLVMPLVPSVAGRIFEVEPMVLLTPVLGMGPYFSCILDGDQSVLDISMVIFVWVFCLCIIQTYGKLHRAQPERSKMWPSSFNQNILSWPFQKIQQLCRLFSQIAIVVCMDFYWLVCSNPTNSINTSFITHKANPYVHTKYAHHQLWNLLGGNIVGRTEYSPGLALRYGEEIIEHS